MFNSHVSFPNFPNLQNLIWDNKLKRNKSKERSQELQNRETKRTRKKRIFRGGIICIFIKSSKIVL